MGSLGSLRRILSSSEKCPINSRCNHLVHCCHYFHLNKFLDVSLEIKLILWNVIPGATISGRGRKEQHSAADDLRAADSRPCKTRSTGRRWHHAPHFPQMKSDPTLSCICVIWLNYLCDSCGEQYQILFMKLQLMGQRNSSWRKFAFSYSSNCII